MQFDIKHRCPYCNQSPTVVTSHDHFLQCIQSGQRKNIRLKKISQFLSSQHTPPIIRKGIINNISKYYNNIAQNDCCLLNTDSEQEDKKIQSQPSITSQNTIGWGHFIRGRISQLFYSQIKQYYKQNRLGKRFRPQFWFNRLINFTLTLHAEEWRYHCAEIHQPTKEKKQTISKTSLLELAQKYIKQSHLLPKSKQIWFGKQVLSMETWSIINIQRWIRKAKSMLRRQNRAKIAPQQQKKFAGLSSSSKTKKHNIRIHHIHHLPSSQIIKQRLPTTMHRFYKIK